MLHVIFTTLTTSPKTIGITDGLDIPGQNYSLIHYIKVTSRIVGGIYNVKAPGIG